MAIILPTTSLNQLVDNSEPPAGGTEGASHATHDQSSLQLSQKGGEADKPLWHGRRALMLLSITAVSWWPHHFSREVPVGCLSVSVALFGLETSSDETQLP